MYEDGRLEIRTFNNQHSILCSALTLHDLVKLGSDLMIIIESHRIWWKTDSNKITEFILLLDDNLSEVNQKINFSLYVNCYRTSTSSGLWQYDCKTRWFFIIHWYIIWKAPGCKSRWGYAISKWLYWIRHFRCNSLGHLETNIAYLVATNRIFFGRTTLEHWSIILNFVTEIHVLDLVAFNIKTVCLSFWKFIYISILIGIEDLDWVTWHDLLHFVSIRNQFLLNGQKMIVLRLETL